MNAQPHDPDDIDGAAAAWFVRVSREDATNADRAALAAWRAGDPRHDHAYAAMERVWQRTGAAAAATAAPHPLVHRRRRAPAIAGGFALAASVALVAFVPAIGDRVLGDTYRTGIGEQRDVTLADGSVVHLDGGSTVRVRLVAAERRVALLDGEAMFDVTKDPVRPFDVQAGARTIRVVGTKFDVHRSGDGATVAVAEGVVRVVGATTTELTVGQKLSYEADADPAAVEPVPASRIGAWRNGVLYYERAPVAQVIADLNRAFAQKIKLADPALGKIPVNVALQVRNREGTLRSLEALLSVKAQQQKDGTTLLVR